MGCSLNVTFLRDKNDQTYKKMLSVFKSCIDAEIEIPEQVDLFFGGDGIDNEIEYPLEVQFNPREWRDDYSEGFEIDVDEIPNGVKTIRVKISY